MEKQKVATQYGEVSYYIELGEHQGLTFYMTLKSGIEVTFKVSEDFLNAEEQDQRVHLFMSGYGQGRRRGSWEKAKRIKELFEDIKLEMLGI